MERVAGRIKFFRCSLDEWDFFKQCFPVLNEISVCLVVQLYFTGFLCYLVASAICICSSKQDPVESIFWPLHFLSMKSWSLHDYALNFDFILLIFKYLIFQFDFYTLCSSVYFVLADICFCLGIVKVIVEH